MTAFGQNSFSREIRKAAFHSWLYSLQPFEQIAQRHFQGSREGL
jgi:hypothetical protein